MDRFPTTDIGRWGEGGTEGGPWASFALRYRGPLSAYARRRFGLDPEFAEELSARFLAREVDRARGGHEPLFRLYEPGQGRFRSLLATVFWRFVRDQLELERRRRGLSLDALPEPAQPTDDELCRLIARELFAVVRGAVAEGCQDEDERRVLALKWPPAGGAPLRNAEVQRELGLSRGRVRSIVARIGERFLAELRRLAEQSGVAPGDLIPLLHDTCRALDRDEEEAAAD